MTIKEIEMLTGMTRANVRFYESEGLISPSRNENGYRDYSEYDLEVLRRVKLLRMLDISLEEIKLLHKGEHELLDTLDKHIAYLQGVKQHATNSQEVCRNIREAKETYETLDAHKYLDVLEHPEQGVIKHTLALEEDQLPKVKAPWRRFFARELDLFLYGTIWSLILMLGFNVMLSGRHPMAELIIDTVITVLMVILIEPVLLTKFGTTFGKWILGLSVTDQEDRRLSYGDAVYRTWKVLGRGIGYGIPGYVLFREYKSYKACTENQVLEWEEDSTLVLKDSKVWRYVAVAGAWIGLIGLMTVGLMRVEGPDHRGYISVAQFSENYNRLADYFDPDRICYLDSTGKWVPKEGFEFTPDGKAIVRSQTGFYGNVFSETGISMRQIPQYEITEERGVMTGLSFHVETEGVDSIISGYEEEMLLLILSYVQAQNGSGLYGKDAKNLLEALNAQTEEEPKIDWANEVISKTFSSEAYGIEVTRELKYWGYYYSSDLNWFVPEDSSEKYYSFFFSMSKK